MKQEKDLREFSYKEQYHKKNQMVKLQDANKDYPMPKNHFKISHNLPNFGQSSSSSSSHLEKLKSITLRTIQNKLLSVFFIFQTKIATRVDSCFHLIKLANEAHFQSYKIQRKAIITASSFFSKLSKVFVRNKLKNEFYFIQNLKVLFGKGRNENSKREMLRINSKIERENEELDIDKNYSNEVTSTGEKTYRHLKKKKQNWEKEFNSFKSQMDQLLTQHQNYLKKH